MIIGVGVPGGHGKVRRSGDSRGPYRIGGRPRKRNSTEASISGDTTRRRGGSEGARHAASIRIYGNSIAVSLPSAVVSRNHVIVVGKLKWICVGVTNNVWPYVSVPTHTKDLASAAVNSKSSFVAGIVSPRQTYLSASRIVGAQVGRRDRLLRRTVGSRCGFAIGG